MSYWKVRMDSPEAAPYEFMDTRRVTGRQVLRPEFLRDLAERGRVIEKDLFVVGPEGKGRYTNTFIIISLSDQRGEVVFLMETYMVGIRIVGVRGAIDVSENLVDLLQDIVRYSRDIEVSIIIPKGYKI
ncbi:MAG: hypothetical protein KIH09_16230 [Candidatus Freyarchaeota archaeon]|nr:hypothetical protein [Candidatus Jordarchaeia archaeon]